MASKKTKSKQDLVDEVIQRRNEIMQNTHTKSGLVDALVPLASFEASKIEMNDDGTVKITFTQPIDAYVSVLTKKKLKAIIDQLDHPMV